MARFYILKSNGEREYFQDKKLFGSLLKAKLNKTDARKIVSIIKKEIRNDTTSDVLQNITYNYLCKTHLPQAQLYTLRTSLADLPPKIFEKFVQKLLEADGYTCLWEQIVRGAGTSHEVDVVAKKDANCFMIECKRRSNWHKPSGLSKALVVRARLEDILDGESKGTNQYGFTRAWLINNAKFSDHARNYASYKGIWLTGWGYPEGKGLNEWIQHLQVYPITMLRIQKQDITKLLTADVITFLDLEESGKGIARKLLGDNHYNSVLQQIQSIRQCSK